jgi:hypothetical protein
MKQNNNVNEQMLRDDNPNRRHNNEAGVTMDLLSVTRMQMKALP